MGCVYIDTCSTILQCEVIINTYTKDKLFQIYPRGSCLKRIQYGPVEVVSGLYVDLQHVADTGQKSDRQKNAMRSNGWLYKIILPARSLILISSFYLGTILIQFQPHANVTPDFQKRKKEIPGYKFKTRDFYHRL